MSGHADVLISEPPRHGAGCRQPATYSRHLGARPQAAPCSKLSFTLKVGRTDVLRIRKAIVCIGGQAVEFLRCWPMCGSSCMRLCIGLEAGCEEAMSRIVRTAEAGGFGRIVSG
jgi:hypothetical protein